MRQQLAVFKDAGARSAENLHAACDVRGGWKRSYGRSCSGTKGEALDAARGIGMRAARQCSTRPGRRVGRFAVRSELLGGDGVGGVHGGAGTTGMIGIQEQRPVTRFSSPALGGTPTQGPGTSHGMPLVSEHPRSVSVRSRRDRWRSRGRTPSGRAGRWRQHPR